MSQRLSRDKPLSEPCIAWIMGTYTALYRSESSHTRHYIIVGTQVRRPQETCCERSLQWERPPSGPPATPPATDLLVVCYTSFMAPPSQLLHRNQLRRLVRAADRSSKVRHACFRKRDDLHDIKPHRRPRGRASQAVTDAASSCNELLRRLATAGFLAPLADQSCCTRRLLKDRIEAAR